MSDTSNQTSTGKSRTPKQRLELTWIGKDEELKLEPRILIEDPKKSYGDPNSENMLIHGDNLLALKALEQDYAGKVKCIYIDPPFNTGSAFEHYDDNLEHSIWLSMMYERLVILHKLLSKSGAIVVNLDDTECAYCKVMLDEIFGRNNYITTIIVEGATTSSFKTVNMGPTQTAQYLLFFAKDKSKFDYINQYIPVYEIDLQHFSRFIINPDEPAENWKFESINDHILTKMGFSGDTPNAKWSAAKKALGAENAKSEVRQHAMEFALENCQRVFETKTLQKPSKWLHEHIQRSLQIDHPISLNRDGMDNLYLYKGRQIYFLGKGVKEIDGGKYVTQPVSNIWLDIPTNNLKKEGGVDFPAGKKPETLLRRVIQMISSDKNDIVLDSFGGSGTTGAVAHKMNRRWIVIELGDQCFTHIVPRMKNVIEAKDPYGITEALQWNGGGGFKFCELAPSLLKKDKFDNWIIDENYNANMLAAAMCKHEGFRFSPHEEIYWKQGKSTETDYIFVTTAFVTVEQLDKIHEEMGNEESLLICTKSFAPECDDRFPNITVKKIPQMILGKCEYGQDNYDLNIIESTEKIAESQDATSNDNE
ncbi:hypothetical protein A3D88_04450 [Candidatus Peribacteria bacterium RIFCSPHIGHO2_02_FULL_52_16]|nr:MAG: hypothetical protein A2706_03080 [Candidatus Peribacteria bacterium RIFCSPHIGHO2_01_FULL_51_35]OGJ60857.1 MAG: hypothetical protein A3D88_04450 [Candidatus Peribacteria bacterium RIFCSPHIGHO2_02_FULL_52_16]HLB59287.1 site-specific DNA-methyltransferase [Bdellovibrionota bacterium]